MTDNDTPLTDDYIASLLSRKAQADHGRYLESGLGQLLTPKSRSRDAPKPNTRFLKNLIRDTDSHNAALLAKEAEESRTRLEGLKRKRESEVTTDRASKKRGDGERPSRWASALGGLGQKAYSRTSVTEGGSRREERERDHTRQRSLSRERRKDDHRRRRQRSASRSHSRSPSRDSRKRRRPSHRDDEGHRDRIHERAERHHKHHRSTQQEQPDYDTARRTARNISRDDGNDESDPLEDVVGPTMPSKSKPRGRGAHKSAFDTIDARFAADYDPKTDVSLEDQEDHDDWEMALEALRDRQKWKSNHTDRLKAAGFTDDEISKAQRGEQKSAEDIESVRWSKKGQDREWDKGKAVGDDGEVNVKAGWAR